MAGSFIDTNSFDSFVLSGVGSDEHISLFCVFWLRCRPSLGSTERLQDRILSYHNSYVKRAMKLKAH